MLKLLGVGAAWVWNFLWQEKLPLWVTLTLTIGGSYLLAPFINQEVQQETLRREFIVKSLEALSTDTIKIVTHANKIIAGDRSSASLDELSAQVIELQYKLVQLNISTPERRAAGIAVQKSLSALQESIKTNDVQSSERELKEFSTLSFNLYETIVRDARLLQ